MPIPLLFNLTGILNHLSDSLHVDTIRSRHTMARMGQLMSFLAHLPNWIYAIEVVNETDNANRLD